MTQAALDGLAADPRYRALVRRRSTLGWTLAGIMVAVYFCFILLVAFAKTWLAQPLAGGATSIGMPVGLGVIVVAIVQTGLYVRQANRVYDHEMAVLLQEYGL
jgi:uncharacterized membrane protein (DUF485 family)